MNRKRREAKEETGTNMYTAPGATKRAIGTQHPRPCTWLRHHQTRTGHRAPPRCHTQRRIRHTKLTHLANKLPRSPRNPSTVHLQRVAACSGNQARKEVHDMATATCFGVHPRTHTCTRHPAPPIMRLVPSTTKRACDTQHKRTRTRHPAPPSPHPAPDTTKVSHTN